MDYHEQLRQLGETLGERVNAMLREHEKDFFLAYKTHMYSVQKQFKALKAKADEEEKKTRQDVKIQSLEKELEWFMNESLRLDDLCKGYKKDVDKWKAKAEALDEDRRFLEDQIKGAKRQNKVLRAAVERAQVSAQSALALQDDTSPRSPGLPALADRPRSSEDTRRLVSQSQMEPVRSRSALALRDGPLGTCVKEQRYLDTIRDMKQEYDREKKTVRMLRAARANAYNQKSELEEFFLKCIHEARKDVLRRRHRSSPDQGVAGDQPPDRRKVIEMLLSSEDVLVFLYEKLFPHRTGMVMSHGVGDAGGVFQLETATGAPGPDLQGE
mmetsp:Transcript_121207/g.277789  ORF Transcript_121207/g.277789 Transcript_121207/m.277789 type:complete len:327 (-) Transcript_121207:97-1077(-)